MRRPLCLTTLVLLLAVWSCLLVADAVWEAKAASWRPGVTAANVARIQPGMTLAEVERLGQAVADLRKFFRRA